MRPSLPALAAVLALAAPAFANDTTAELKTGGLVYLQSPDIAMEEEDLYISMEEVRVDYVFRNTSDADIAAVVAFPMPDVEGGSQSDIAVGDAEADNFLGFSVTQDGAAFQPELDQRVVALGIDRTEDLRRAGVPLLPYSEKTFEALKALPEEVRADLFAKGMLLKDVYDLGQGEIIDWRPLWTLKSAYWWKTTFPKGKPTRVSHRYAPSVGGTVAISFLDNGKPAYNYAEYRPRYCLDDAFLKTAAKLEKGAYSGTGPNYTESWVSYVLTTGANWAGGIGRFRLTVDKGKPENYVSFCGEGVRKTGPTTFTMEKTDFTPEKDLHILFLVPLAGD